MKISQREHKINQTEDSTDSLLALFVLYQWQKTQAYRNKIKKWLQPGISEIDAVGLLSIIQFWTYFPLLLSVTFISFPWPFSQCSLQSLDRCYHGCLLTTLPLFDSQKHSHHRV